MEGKSKLPIAKLNDLLGVFDGKLPPCTFWHGTKAPVFIIEEANELNKLTEQPDGHDALHNFFKWLVMNTKELNRFHVILSSSDSFFHLWVSNYVGAHRFKTWVIGDLPEGEAEQFWQHLYDRSYSRLCSLYGCSPPTPNFKDLYRVCGGSIFLIKAALLYWFDQHSIQKPVEWKRFPYVQQEKAKLTKAYHLSDHMFQGKSKPRWKKQDLIGVMKSLVESKSGYELYCDLCFIWKYCHRFVD